MPNEGVQGNQGKVRDMHVAHELSGKSQEIQLILGNIREISRKSFEFVSSMNRFPNMLKN